MASKLCPHALRPTADAKLLVQAGCRLIKLVDDFGAASEFLAINPNLIIVGRSYTPSTLLEQLNNGATPEAAARSFVLDQKARIYDRNPLVKIWEGHNEPSFGGPNDPGAIAKMAWYGRYEAARVKIMADLGLRSVVGNFSTGYPEILPNDQRMWNAFLPALEACRQYNGLLGLHEYSAPWVWWMTGKYQRGNCTDMRFSPGWHEEDAGLFGWTTLRYRRVYRHALAPQGLDVVPLVITEFGTDAVGNNCPGTPSGAWRDLAGFWDSYDGSRDPIDYWKRPRNNRDAERYYAEQLIWYDREMQKDAYVLGATIFTFGSGSATWERYRVDGTRVPKFIADHIRQTINEPTLPLPPLFPPPPPEPEPPVVIDDDDNTSPDDFVPDEDPDPTPSPTLPTTPSTPTGTVRGQPREQYSRIYMLLPPTANDPAWVDAIADATWAQRRFTIGGSADDAAIGNLHARMVLAINPQGWGSTPTLDQWFTRYYPGVNYASMRVNTPAELKNALQSMTLPAPVIARPNAPNPVLGTPREQYARTYILMNPNHVDPAWVKAVARVAWVRRVTIGGSADDAGIGDLNTRKVIVLNPRESYDSDIFAWFSRNYPNVNVQGAEGRTPDEVAQQVKRLLEL